MADLDKEVAGLKKEIAQAQATVKKLDAERRDNEAENEAVYMQGLDLQPQLCSLKDEIYALGKEEENQANLLRENMNILRGLELDLLKAEADRCKLAKQAKNLENEKARLVAKSSRGNEVPLLERLLTDLGLKIDEARGRLAMLEDLCQDTAQDIRDKQFQVSAEADTAGDLHQRLGELEAAIREKEGLIAEAQGGKGAKKDQLRALQERNRVLKCEIDVCAAVVAESEMVNRELVNNISNILRSNQEVKNMLSRKQEVLASVS